MKSTFSLLKLILPCFCLLFSNISHSSENEKSQDSEKVYVAPTNIQIQNNEILIQLNG
jgi:hypothetical protein